MLVHRFFEFGLSDNETLKYLVLAKASYEFANKIKA